MPQYIHASSRAVKLEKGKMTDFPTVTVRKGNPIPSGKVFLMPNDESFSQGLWTCTPGEFTIEFTWDETLYLLEGKLTVEDESGRKYNIGPGDFFYFPKGCRVKWTIHKKMKKVFITRPWYQSTFHPHFKSSEWIQCDYQKIVGNIRNPDVTPDKLLASGPRRSKTRRQSRRGLNQDENTLQVSGTTQPK